MKLTANPPSIWEDSRAIRSREYLQSSSGNKGVIWLPFVRQQAYPALAGSKNCFPENEKEGITAGRR
jgi:hypothetical protein